MADGKSGALFSSGFIMMIHHPKDFPVEGNPLKLIEIGVITSVAVYPTLSRCTDDVLALPSKTRRCVQPGDMDGANYRQPACDVECTRNYMYRTCGCHPFYMPYPTKRSSVRECMAVDAVCFSKHMCKKCVDLYEFMPYLLLIMYLFCGQISGTKERTMPLLFTVMYGHNVYFSKL